MLLHYMQVLGVHFYVPHTHNERAVNFNEKYK